MLKSSQKEFFPLEWYDGKIVRYGNIDSSHPSHFLYAVHDCFQEFRNLTQSDKQTYIDKQRKILGDRVDFKIWKRLVSVRSITDYYVKEFQNDIQSQNVISRIIENPNRFFHKITEEVVHETHIETFVLNSFQKCLENVEKREKKTIDEAKKQKCSDLFFKFHESIWNKSLSSLFQTFRERCRDPLVPIDNFMMTVLLYTLPTNVFFIDKDIQNIVTIDADYFIFTTDRNTANNIFLLYSYPLSFESLGVVESPYENSPKHVKIRKLFPLKHDFVQTALKQV